VRFRFRTRYARRALALFVALALVLVSGTEVAALGGANLCRGWPLCVDVILNPTGATLLALGHRLLVGVLLVGMLWLLRASWRRQRSQTALLTPRSRPLERESTARVSQSWPTRFASWRNAPRMRQKI